VVGTWSSSGTSAVFTITPDHKWSMPFTQRTTMTGTWTYDGNDVTLTPVAANGRPVAEVKKFMESKADKYGGDARKMADDLDKPNVFTLSADGSTLTTDKSKDRNSGPGFTLQKDNGPRT
jgi:hypothetical protein